MKLYMQQSIWMKKFFVYFRVRLVAQSMRKILIVIARKILCINRQTFEIIKNSSLFRFLDPFHFIIHEKQIQK